MNSFFLFIKRYNILIIIQLLYVWEKAAMIPLKGIGTYKADYESIVRALQNGFKLLDTAKAYENEEMVGKALTICENSSDVVIITKLARLHLENLETMQSAINDSIHKLGRIPDYFLIHGPYPDIPLLEVAAQLEKLKEKKIIKNWGVSNFEIEHLALFLLNNFKPVLNQVEYHFFFQRPALLDYCRKYGITLQAYRPLCRGKVLHEETVNYLAQKRQISTAQLAFGWFLGKQLPLVTQASSAEHQEEYKTSEKVNFTNNEMLLLSSLHQPYDLGRTCTKGNWCVPFTTAIQKNWET